MEPALVVGLLWLSFGAFHIGLGSTAVRAWLVAALGELGFTAVFSLVSAAWFTAIVRTYAPIAGRVRRVSPLARSLPSAGS